MRWLTLVFLVELHPVFSDYTELMRSEMGVKVEPLQIFFENDTLTPSQRARVKCRLTLHKDSCSSPALQLNDTVKWSTRVCYKWACDAYQYAMRVESCWIGTVKNPVYLIKSDGCTMEKAILTSPVYSSFNRAAAIGWLSVREQGNHVLEKVHNHTLRNEPPKSCKDGREADYVQMWKSSSRVKNVCYPEPKNTTEMINAATFINFVPIFVPTLLLFCSIW